MNHSLAKPWAIMQQVEWEGPGLIATELAAAGIEFTIFRMDRGAALPVAAEIGGLIVMGGPMAVYEAEQYPFLRGELRLIGAALRAELPVLGVCLGAQLLATVLGATVRQGAVFETGIGEVKLTPAGRADAVIGGVECLPVMHWHQDTFDLPSGATHLGASAAYPQQAFRLNRRVYGLQFHFELDAALAAAWLPRLSPEHRFSEARRQAVAAAGAGLMRRFLQVAGS